MVQYRRNRIGGGTYFFTVTLKDRRSRLLHECVQQLRASYAQVRRERPFETVAVAVLPEHLHAIWTLPEGDADYSGRWRSIKGGFSQSLAAMSLIEKQRGQRRYDLWQSRFWEHTIRDEDDLRRHIDYIHYNPVKHGLVSRVVEWPHSSFHRFVERGDLTLDWATGPSEEGTSFGE
jgi:putative transposase